MHKQAAHGGICFDKVGKSYGGQRVLSDVSFDIGAGESVALMGASGRGKTTLIRILMGLETPDEGRVLGAEGLRFGCVFQEDRLCEQMSAVDNVAIALPRGGGALALRALGELGLDGADLYKPVCVLSGGQRRRVALARAAENDNDALVLDEAFKGLDETARRAAYAYILAHRRGRLMLVVTHDEDEASALCGRRVQL